MSHLIPALALLDVADMVTCINEYLNEKDIRSLMNTSKQLADMKKLHVYWNLTYDRSACYYYDPAFRRQLHQLMLNPNTQITLRFSTTKPSSSDSPNFIYLGNVHQLIIDDSPHITDVSALSHVHSLNLSGCNGITDVRNIKMFVLSAMFIF